GAFTCPGPGAHGFTLRPCPWGATGDFEGISLIASDNLEDDYIGNRAATSPHPWDLSSDQSTQTHTHTVKLILTNTHIHTLTYTHTGPSARPLTLTHTHTNTHTVASQWAS